MPVKSTQLDKLEINKINTGIRRNLTNDIKDVIREDGGRKAIKNIDNIWKDCYAVPMYFFKDQFCKSETSFQREM